MKFLCNIFVAAVLSLLFGCGVSAPRDMTRCWFTMYILMLVLFPFPFFFPSGKTSSRRLPYDSHQLLLSFFVVRKSCAPHPFPVPVPVPSPPPPGRNDSSSPSPLLPPLSSRFLPDSIHVERTSWSSKRVETVPPLLTIPLPDDYGERASSSKPKEVSRPATSPATTIAGVDTRGRMAGVDVRGSMSSKPPGVLGSTNPVWRRIAGM
jgi:hypothetical protein